MPLVLQLPLDETCVQDPFSICDALTNFSWGHQVTNGEGYKFFDGKKMTSGTHFCFGTEKHTNITI